MNAVSAVGLRKRFGTSWAVDGVDLEIPAGSLLALVGPNGAGKSTTVRILTTLTRSDEGTAHVAGFDVARAPAEVRRFIGVAAQQACVDGRLTGRENLILVGRLHRLSGALARRRAAELVDQFRLAPFADRLAQTYSGGVRRRFDLAASLVNRPRVLFLDEPTTGLDPRSRQELWAVVEDHVADGTAVLLTTQYLDEADRLADRILVLRQGRVIASGTADELKRGLGAEVLAIRVSRPDDIARAAALLCPGTGPRVSVDHAAAEVSMATADSAAALVQVIRRLDDAGVPVAGVQVRRPSLDDVFLALTTPDPRIGPVVAAVPSTAKGGRG